jgi:chromosome segregation ATPase
MCVPLAISDGFAITMWIVNLLISAGITMVLARVALASGASTGRRTRTTPTPRACATRWSEQAKTLHQVTEKLIDERFRKVTHQVENHALVVSGTLAELKQQIKDGEQDLDGLGERDQKIELAVAAKLDQLKDWIRDTTATSRDLEKHEQSMGARLGKAEERMTKELGELGRTVAVLAERVGTGKRGA